MEDDPLEDRWIQDQAVVAAEKLPVFLSYCVTKGYENEGVALPVRVVNGEFENITALVNDDDFNCDYCELLVCHPLMVGWDGVIGEIRWKWEEQQWGFITDDSEVIESTPKMDITMHIHYKKPATEASPLLASSIIAVLEPFDYDAGTPSNVLGALPLFKFKSASPAA
tara:strand:+ start:296 stop:799 length:504 start_codon:yes stop_codon:yes gene_type:complete